MEEFVHLFGDYKEVGLKQVLLMGENIYLMWVKDFEGALYCDGLKIVNEELLEQEGKEENEVVVDGIKIEGSYKQDVEERDI